MRRVSVLLLLLFEFCVTMTVVARARSPEGRVDKHNEGHRECEEHLDTKGLHRTMTGSKISVKISGPIKIASTTRSTPRANDDPKISEHQPRTTELAYKFPQRLLDRSSLTHALSRRLGDESASTGHVGEGTRSLRASFVTKVLLPLLFSFKLQATAVAILLVLLAIKKVIIASALLIPIVNKTKFTGHYTMDVKFPRSPQEHGYYGYMRAHPYGTQLEQKLPHKYYAQPYGSQLEQKAPHKYYAQPYGSQLEQTVPHKYYALPYGSQLEQKVPHKYYAQPYGTQLEQKVPQQHYVIPHPNGPQVYTRKVNTGVNTIGSTVNTTKLFKY